MHSLVKFVSKHGINAELRDDVVWGEAVSTIRQPDGTFLTLREWEPAGSTYEDVRDWLGY